MQLPDAGWWRARQLVFEVIGGGVKTIYKYFLQPGQHNHYVTSLASSDSSNLS